MSLANDIAGLLADRRSEEISSSAFEYAVARRVQQEERRLPNIDPFTMLAYTSFVLWKEFLVCFFAFHFLIPLTPLGKAPEIFGFGTTVWYFTVLPVSIFSSLVVSFFLKMILTDMTEKCSRRPSRRC